MGTEYTPAPEKLDGCRRALKSHAAVQNAINLLTAHRDVIADAAVAKVADATGIKPEEVVLADCQVIGDKLVVEGK